MNRAAAGVLGAVVLAVGAVAVGQPSGATDPITDIPAVAPAPVVRASAVCPSLDLPLRRDTAALAVPSALVTGGQVVASRLGDPDPIGTVDTPGQVLALGATRGPLVVRADAGTAPGLAAGQQVLGLDAEVTGLAAAPCATPTGDAWFVGGDGAVGRRMTVLLANPADAPALVDVTVWDEDGEVPAPGSQDLGVAPGSVRTVPVDALAAGSRALAVRVSTDQGSVAAAVLVRETEGLDPRGLSWVPSAAAPGTIATVVALPAGTSRTVRVLNPGEQDAVARIQVLGPTGPVVGASGVVRELLLDVPAGTVAERSLEDLAAGSDAAVRVETSVPVVVGTRAETGGSVADLALGGAASPLDGPAAVVLHPTQPATLQRRLVLVGLGVEGAPPTTVTLRLQTAGGAELASWTRPVPPGTVVPVTVPPRAGGRVLLVEAATPGTVAAALVARGSADVPNPIGERGTRPAELLDVVPLSAPRAVVAVVPATRSVAVTVP
jgi:hypothetical protein